MRIALALVFAVPALAQETVGPWTIQAAPVDFFVIGNPGSNWGWLNVQDAPVTAKDAFTGFPLIEQGYANPDTGTIFELVFAPGTLANLAGPDLVVLEGRYDAGSFSFSADHDDFSTFAAVTGFVDSGEQRDYYYEGNANGPFHAAIWGAEVDLSDVGVPDGQAVGKVRIRTLDKQLDPIAFGSLQAGAPIGTSYCGPAQLNSSGQAGAISAFGSEFVVTEFVRLDAGGLAHDQFSYFLTSQTQGFVVPPGSQGILCLGGTIGRFNQDVLDTGATGTVSLEIDLNDHPVNGGVAVLPGETWNYQLWFRDDNPHPTSNFTDGIAITYR